MNALLLILWRKGGRKLSIARLLSIATFFLFFGFVFCFWAFVELGGRGWEGWKGVKLGRRVLLSVFVWRRGVEVSGIHVGRGKVNVGFGSGRRVWT